MKITFDLRKLRHNPETPWFIIDILMVVLVTFNLLWILFDALFASEMIARGIAWLSPAFHDFYASRIHNNFTAYDMIFVGIYIAELLLRWAVAIARKTYHRWFFFPFVHWYDVLGCIPIGSFRFLRILRVISIIYRLQKLGIIDIRQNYFYQLIAKYLNVLTEEFSDRVVVHILDGIQRDIREGNPLARRIRDEAIAPKRDDIIRWLGQRIGQTAEAGWQGNQQAIDHYLRSLLDRSLNDHSTVGRLLAIPVVGPQLQGAVEETVLELIKDMVNNLVTDLADPENPLASTVIHGLLQENSGQKAEALWPIIQTALLDSLELVKDQVKIQQWKLDEQLKHPDTLT